MPGAEDLVNYLNAGGDPAQAPGVNPDVAASAGAGADYAALLGYAPSQQAQLPPVQQLGAGLDTGESPDAQPQAPSKPAQPTQALPPGISGAGVKTGASGYSPAANAAIQAGPKKGVEAGLERDRAAVESNFAPIVEESHKATQAAIDAELKVGNIESAKLRATAESKLKIAAANKEFMTKEQAAIDNARTEADKAHADYRTALADYQAAKVNPRQLWENAGAGGQFAMMVTAFAHDFLGAKGIQTSGMDTINKAIQNNINAQVENIRKKGDVANGFKALWDMQRAQSATDAEARQRMQGFYLAAMSNEIEAKLGSYDSDLALAKAQSAKAKLMDEQVKNDLLVRQHIDTSANQRATNRVHMYAAELQASSAKYTADAHLQAAKIAADKGKQGPLVGLIRNTTPEGKNVAIRRLNPEIKPEKAAEIQEQTSKVLHTSSAMQNLIDLQAQIDKTPPTDISALKKLQSEEQRAAEQVRQLVRNSLLYDNTGKAINEQEMKIQNDMVSKKDWWTNGDNVRALALYAKYNLDKQNEILGQVSTEILPGDPAYGHSSGTRKVGEELSTLLDVEAGPNGGKPTEGPAYDYQKWAFAPNAGQAFDTKKLPETGPGNKAQVEHDWTQFRSDNPSLSPNLDNPGDLRRRIGPSAKESDIFSNPEATDTNQPDRAFIQIERLADLAIQGDKKAKGVIDELAKGKAYGGSEGSDGASLSMAGLLSAYAQWEKSNKGL